MKPQRQTPLQMDTQSPFDIKPKKQTRKQEKPCNKWSFQENQESKEDFLFEYKRRSTKIFRRLSEHVKTRNDAQCKSHHQKMIKNYHNIQNIIQQLPMKMQNKKVKANVEILETKQKSQLPITQITWQQKQYTNIYNNILFEEELFNVLVL